MMALPSGCAASFPLLTLLLMSSISLAAGGTVGVAYGRVADNLMPPPQVVELLKANGIGAVSIYDTDDTVLRALANTGINVVVALPNEQLAAAAANPDNAATWVRDHVQAYYPATQITDVRVGNEVFQQRPDLSSSLVGAMQNVYDGLAKVGLANAIKVSSPVAFDALDVSFPPSQGRFRGDLQSYIRPMLDFHRRTGSDFTVNIYPYFAYRDNPNINLDYALGRLPNPGAFDDQSGKSYFSLLDAQLDAVYSAVDALGATSTDTVGASQKSTVGAGSIGESGWPSRGENSGGKSSTTKRSGTNGVALNASLAEERGASVENAKAFNNYLVQKVLSGSTGTPLHPDADLDVYVFSLFNENLKPGPESERNFGLFYPDGTKVYDVPFHPVTPPSPGPGGDSWCVADPAAGTARMQAALDWACGPGGADCGPIQPGGRCFQPDTVEAHASYAMNDYYQRHNRGAGTCDFQGVGRVVTENPNFCSGTGDSLCVENPAVGTDRMNSALDWACGPGGADCGPIQLGAPSYEPNTMEAHASYAMDSYYQKHNCGAGTCDF